MGVLTVVVPAAALANKSPEFTPANLPWVLLAECAVVALETALLQWMLKLSPRAALRTAVLANAASFFGGWVVLVLLTSYFGGMILGSQGGYVLLGILADIFRGSWEVDTPAGTAYFLTLGFNTVLTMLFESPVVYWLLPEEHRRSLGSLWHRILLVNVISYPLFYTGLYLVTVWRSR